MESIKAQIDQIRLSAATLTRDERCEISDALRDLSISLENNQTSARRLLYLPMQLMALRIGCDLGLFKILCDGKRAFTVDELSHTTEVAPILMGRLLRYMASFRIIQETAKDEFAANNVTETFAIPGYDSAVRYNFEEFAPAVWHTPAFLRERGYKDVDNAADCPYSASQGSNLPTFDIFAQKPEMYWHFQQFMKVHCLGAPSWLEVYPYQQATKGLDPERVFFVDIGGGHGHQGLALRKMLPDLKNRIINQDLPAALKGANEELGVEMISHDFFEPQPIKGAKIYYMRYVLHDWPDHRAVTILNHIRQAMEGSQDAVLLIDEAWLGTQDVNWTHTQLDLCMMITVSALERTESLWNDLLGKAGLKVQKVYALAEQRGDCVIECVVA